MKKRLKIIGVSALAIFILAISVILFVQKGNSSSSTCITAPDQTVEFDGSPKKLEATASREGSLTYVYTGLDCDYHSALEPTEAGEYEVSITFKPYDKKGRVETATARLTIALPYELTGDNKTIIKYTGSSKDVVLPRTYKNHTFTLMDKAVFSGLELISIKLPLGEISLSPKALEGAKVNKLYLTEDSKLLSGSYPEGLEIEYYNYPHIISQGAFGEIDGIDQLTLPESVREVDKSVLSQISLKKLNIYSNLSLGGCDLSPTIKEVVVQASKDKTVANGLLKDCKFVESVTIKSEIELFGSECFIGADSLKKLDMFCCPFSTEGKCFDQGFSLESMTFEMNYIPQMRWFLENLGISNIKTLHLKGIKGTEEGCFGSCNMLEEVIIEGSVTALGNMMFDSCENLSKVTLPSGLKRLGKQAFYGCKNLTTIDLPEELEIVEMHAFSSCKSLESIVIPENVTEISDMAFLNCTSLTSITLPQNLQVIGDKAFMNTKIEELTLPQGVKNIKGSIFPEGLKKLTIMSTTLPDFGSNPKFSFSVDCEIYVHSGLIEKYRELFPDYTFLAF